MPRLSPYGARRSTVTRMAFVTIRAAFLLGLSLAASGCSKKPGNTLPSLDTWQGIADIAIETDGKAGTLTVAKRGDTYRFEAPQNPELFGSYGGAEGPRRFLLDGKAKTLTLVVDASKQAMEYDVTVLDGLANKDTAESFELAASGRQGTVAGFSCDVWVGSGNGTSVEACVVKQTASAFRLGVGFLPADSAWAKTLLDGDHVALSVVVKEGEAVRFKAQLTGFSQNVPEGEFDVPKDYDRQNFLKALQRIQAKQNQPNP